MENFGKKVTLDYYYLFLHFIYFRAIQICQEDIIRFSKELLSFPWLLQNLVFLDKVGFDNRDNKRIIGMYLMASEDKASESKKNAREKSLQSNRAPVVFRRVDIHTLLRRMKAIINETKTTDRVRCSAAAIIVEMCTGGPVYQKCWHTPNSTHLRTLTVKLGNH